MSAHKENDNRVFDLALFGALLKKERMDEGCKTAEALSEWVEYTTGVCIPRETIIRFEAGKQEPKLTQALAIITTLYSVMPQIPADAYEGAIDPIAISCSGKLRYAGMHGSGGYNPDEISAWKKEKELQRLHDEDEEMRQDPNYLQMLDEVARNELEKQAAIEKDDWPPIE